MSGRLAGRRILVTGAARGIGAATVLRFRQEGAKVAALDLDGEALARFSAQAGAADLTTLVADVADPEAVEQAVAEAARALDGLDGLVNAVGIDLVASVEAMTPAQWARIIAVNLTGPMLVMRAAFRHLRAHSPATIVNLSSAAGLSPLRGRTAYCASKGGLQMASKALAIEGAEGGVRVNVVCPGAVETDLFRSSLAGVADPEAAREAVKARYALRRIAEPEEIAEAILFLTSAESSYVTGATLAVDGGRTFH